MPEDLTPTAPTSGPWARFPGTFVSLRIEPIGDPEDRQQYRFINDAQSGRVMGTLRLDNDELKFFTERMFAPSAGVQDSYQSWLQARLSSPNQYSINGRKLSTYSINEQLQYLNTFWKSGKPVPLDT